MSPQPLLFIVCGLVCVLVMFLPLHPDSWLTKFMSSYLLIMVHLCLHLLFLVSQNVRAYLSKRAKLAWNSAHLLTADEHEWLINALTSAVVGYNHGRDLGDVNVRFQGSVQELVVGQPEEAAIGVMEAISGRDLSQEAIDLRKARGVEAIIQEIEAHGTEEDIECLKYVY